MLRSFKVPGSWRQPARYGKSAMCPICRCTVLVRKSPDFSQSVMKALAMADHIVALHRDLLYQP